MDGRKDEPESLLERKNGITLFYAGFSAVDTEPVYHVSGTSGAGHKVLPAFSVVLSVCHCGFGFYL